MKFHENTFSGSRQIDRRTDMPKLVVAFLKFRKRLKEKLSISHKINYRWIRTSYGNYIDKNDVTDHSDTDCDDDDDDDNGCDNIKDDEIYYS